MRRLAALRGDKISPFLGNFAEIYQILDQSLMRPFAGHTILKTAKSDN
jgi:hypothetical protein